MTEKDIKLRTFKDLDLQFGCEEVSLAIQYSIKQEAIKWIKDDIKKFGKLAIDFNRRFMRFHNITEEDLK